MKNNKQAAIGFIFITMLLDVTGWGIIIPVIPKLIKELINADVSEAAKYGGWLTFAYAFTQFVCAPIVGALSDKFGRRPIILISLFGFAIDYLFLSIAPTILWLFIGRVVAGITGASITTASAYIADVSTPENRAKNFGMIGAAFGLGFVIGPVIGGLLGQYGSRVPFVAAGVLCLLNFLYGFFVLPESLKPENRREFDWKRANPIGSFKSLQRYPEVIKLVFVLFLVYVASKAVEGNWSFFTMYKFGWTEKMIGISLGVVGILVSVVQGGLVRFINPKLGNIKSVYVGLGLYTLGMFLFAFASQSWMMFAILVPYCLGGIAGPAINAMVVANVKPNEQGEMSGTLTSIMSVAAIVGPPLMTGIFYFFTHSNAPFQFAGAPFFLGGILMFFSVLIAYFNFKKKGC